MPLATIHLIELSSDNKIADFLALLSSLPTKPIVVSRCVRWIIKPEKLTVSQLLAPRWDLFLVLPATDSPGELREKTQAVTKTHWSMTVGIPSRVLDGFQEKNERLLKPKSGDVPALTGSMDKPRMTSSTQGLELNDELLNWSKTFDLGKGAVSMLNLLSFKPDHGADESYRRYGKAFAESIGRKRGGNAKLVGKVVTPKGAVDDGWAEFALAHYPSIDHFVDMIASEDYQDVNHRDRLPSLKDTCILCTSELDPELWKNRPKL